MEWTCIQVGKSLLSVYCLLSDKMMFHIAYWNKNYCWWQHQNLATFTNLSLLNLWPGCGVCEWDWTSLCCAPMKCVPLDILWELHIEYCRVVLMRWWRHKRRKYVSLKWIKSKLKLSYDCVHDCFNFVLCTWQWRQKK